jgi:hypothetical protein
LRRWFDEQVLKQSRPCCERLLSLHGQAAVRERLAAFIFSDAAFTFTCSAEVLVSVILTCLAFFGPAEA